LNRFLKATLKEAKAYKYEKLLNYKLCATIVSGGSILSTGYNKTSGNSFVQYLANIDQTKKPFMNLHAEVSAILKVRNKIDLTGCKIYVARYKPNNVNEVGMARPCATCEVVLKNYGISRAYYTIDEHHYGIMNLSSGTDQIIRIKV
jgi:deoxycytidylate deaminase